MLVCGYDYETNGISPEEHYVTEIGAVLFDGTTWEPKAEFSSLIFDERALPLSEDIVRITGIRDEDVRTGRLPQDAFTLFARFAKQADVMLSHNKQFEVDFSRSSIARYSLHEFASCWHDKQHVCTNEDVDHADKKCRKLSHLVVDYGGMVDGSKLHWALPDVYLMGNLMRLIGKPVEEHIAYAKEPWVYIQAQTSFDQKELAKAAGYGWQTCPGTYYPIFPKKWVKRIKAREFEEFKKTPSQFSRIQIEPEGTPTQQASSQNGVVDGQTTSGSKA